jgi:hypothetical protein
MKKAVWSGMAVAAAFVCFSSPAYAQATDTANVVVSVNVSARARLTLSALAINFPDSDPDADPSIVATPLNVAVKARTTSGSNITLTVQANGPLTAGANTIPIANLTWTTTGAGYVAGTSASATAQPVGSFTGSNNHAGTQTFALLNSWAYNIGTYTATLTYTLTAP